MVDRDFEAHLQDLFDAPVALDDTEQFTLLIESDLRRMRQRMLWGSALAAALAAACVAAGLYPMISVVLTRWSSEISTLTAQAQAATPYSSFLIQGMALLLGVVAAAVGLVRGRRM